MLGFCGLLLLLEVGIGLFGFGGAVAELLELGLVLRFHSLPLLLGRGEVLLGSLYIVGQCVSSRLQVLCLLLPTCHVLLGRCQFRFRYRLELVVVLLQSDELVLDTG